MSGPWMTARVHAFDVARLDAACGVNVLLPTLIHG